MLLHRISLLLILVTLLNTDIIRAQDDDDSGKDGWSVTPVPALAYDSDFGYMIGGFVDMSYFGGLYPQYKHRLCAEVLAYSKHASSYMFQYDSKYLIPGLRTSAKVFYDDNPLYWFYGFNGYVHDYDRSLNVNPKKGVAYYSYDRKDLHASLDLNGRFTAHLDWTSRLSYRHYWIRELNWKGYDSDNTLLRRYKMLGLIEDSESRGGSIMELQIGIKYDSRDIEPTPTRGIYADINLAYAPDVFNTGYDWLKLAARFRQYISLGTERLVLAYSLAYQGTLAGNQPFYMQSYIIDNKPSDGLGGATTLRGTLYNRVIGNDYVWANLELRTRIIDMKMLNRRVFGVITPFFDAGAILQPFRFEQQAQAFYADDNVTDVTYEQYRSTMLDRTLEPHLSVGISGQVVIDYHFIPSISFGIPFDKRDGDYGLYMTLDYIF